jgi:hypothetical protein
MKDRLIETVEKGKKAEQSLKDWPPGLGGRPSTSKYDPIISAAKERIETGAVVPKPGELTDFVRTLTSSETAVRTIRNKLRKFWNAHLNK